MKKMLSLVRSAIEDYDMIKEGDRVAVGVSGGKDSLSLLQTLALLKNFYPKKFEVEAITIDMGFDGCDFSNIQKMCDELGVRFTVVKSEIKQVIFDIRKEKNPCSLCAKMRRGVLHSAAVELGCNKVALGHHFDDVVETYFLCLFYEGRISCFSPVTYLSRANIELIRPLIYVHERDTINLARRIELPILHNPCPVDGYTKRAYIKNLLKTLEKEHKGLRQRIFGAIQRSAIEGWRIPSHSGDAGIK